MLLARLGQPLFGELLDFAQFGDGGLEVFELSLQRGEAFVDLGGQQVDLLAAVGVVEAEIVGDVAQGEAQALAAQDQDEAGAVAAAEDAGGADAFGRQQALGFVEADGARGDAEFLGKVGNGEQVAVFGFGAAHLWALVWAYSSRSSFLLSLPISVLGRASLKMICLGISILLRRSARNFLRDSSVTLWPALSLT